MREPPSRNDVAVYLRDPVSLAADLRRLEQQYRAQARGLRGDDARQARAAADECRRWRDELRACAAARG